MRYVIRKNNGVWHVFDTLAYEVVSAYPANRMRSAGIEAHSLNQPAGVSVGALELAAICS